MNIFGRLFQLFGIDRAIGWTLLGRGWSLLAGPVTLWLIAYALTPEVQGYYYTFASLVALNVFFELGLAFVLVQKVSHEKAHLEWTSNRLLQGKSFALDRLRQYFQLAQRWYRWVAILFSVAALLIGAGYFSRFSDASEVSWQGPWICTVVAQSLLLLRTPSFALIEGSGKVSDVACYRWLEPALANGTAWLVLIYGGGLWAVAIIPFSSWLIGLVWLRRYSGFFQQLKGVQAESTRVDWKKEVLPLQWRIAISWLSGFFIFQLFVPLIFASAGAVEAGRFGMTINLVRAAGTGAIAWISTKIPSLGSHSALRQWDEMNKIFFKALRQSTILLVIVNLMIIAGLYLVMFYSKPLAERFLSPELTGLLCLAAVATHFIIAFASYLRVHGKEPFLAFSIANGILMVSAILPLSHLYGTVGVTAGYAGVQVMVMLPWAIKIFITCRRSWHVSGA